MSLLRQTWIVSRLSLAALPQRLRSSIVILVGTACVVGVLLSMLSVTAGLVRLYRSGESPNRAIVLGKGSTNAFHGLSREAVAAILGAPGIARDAVGKPLADPELLVQLPPAEGFASGSLNVLGVGPAGLAIRSELNIARGKMFHPGLHELIVGESAHRMFHLELGDAVILPDGDWRIVGIFRAAGGPLESQLITDAETLRASARSDDFGSMLMQVAAPAEFDVLRNWLTSRPALSVIVERQVDHDSQSISATTRFFTVMAFTVGTMLAIGALFGTINITYGAVSARVREIATLRAIGYAAVPIGVSVILEAIWISLAGAALGASIAWLTFDGKLSMANSPVFENQVSARLLAIGLGWALVLAVVGSLFPAIRAGKLSVADALRAT